MTRHRPSIKSHSNLHSGQQRATQSIGVLEIEVDLGELIDLFGRNLGGIRFPPLAPPLHVLLVFPPLGSDPSGQSGIVGIIVGNVAVTVLTKVSLEDVVSQFPLGRGWIVEGEPGLQQFGQLLLIQFLGQFRFDSLLLIRFGLPHLSRPTSQGPIVRIRRGYDAVTEFIVVLPAFPQSQFPLGRGGILNLSSLPHEGFQFRRPFVRQ
mmetsp:Transcript_31158/g.93419  ORF Transcript_31158/g.93419 Transcript_31158/m.93419 type:complete len:207 (-) Transcript_31158:650-1270(-)